MITILHFSDYHYKSDKDADFRNIADKLIKAVATLQTTPDLIVFSGDLLYDNISIENYRHVLDFLINPLLETLHLSKDKLLMVPGNHDMKLNDEMPMVRNELNKCQNVSELENFIANEEQFNLSIKRFKIYTQFAKEFYENIFDVNPLYISGRTEINGLKIGMIGINSAWRCYKSTEDRGQLLFPISMAKNAFYDVKDCDLIMSSMHHNISDFKEFIDSELNDIICENSHLLFTGHYHKSSTSSSVTPNDIGLFHNVAPATYNRNDVSSQYGFTLLNIEETTYDVEITQYLLIEGQGTFMKMPSNCLTIPMSYDKKQINDFRKLIRRKLIEAKRKADDLFVYGKGAQEGQTFKSLFKEPIIKDKSVQELLASKKIGQRYLLLDILKKNKNAIIFGHDKCGKTSLLYKLLIDSLENYSTNNILPIYIDYCKIRDKVGWSVIDELRKYYDLNKKNAENLSTKYKIVLLLDGFNLNDSNFVEMVQAQIVSVKNIFMIACCEETMSGQCALINFEDQDISKYYIHDITPREVHQLTYSWPNLLNDKRREIENKIVHIFTQMHIPFNYWTTSLFLWVLEKTDEANIHNNFELINLYIDEILDKKGFIMNPNLTITYDDLKSYLGSLAKYLYEEKYSIDESRLINFTTDYRNVNKKFTISTVDMIFLLKDKAILIEKNNNYTFRLKGVFEYFLAYKMKEDENFKNDILTADKYFFAFGNELELYAGFQKDDYESVVKVFDIVKKYMKPITSKDDYFDVDNKLGSKLQISKSDFIVTGKLLDRITKFDDMQDDCYLPFSPVGIDDTKVQEKKPIEDLRVTSGLVEKSLFILSRVYRNSNVCNKIELSNEILNYILAGTCNLGFLIIDDAKQLGDLDEDLSVDLAKMVSNFMPVIVEAFLFDALCQRNLVRVMEEKLIEFSKSPEGNEFRIFLLSMILVDLDPQNNLHLLKECLNKIKLKTLRFAIISKLALIMLNNSENASLRRNISQVVGELKNEFQDFKNFHEIMNKKMIEKKAENMHLKHLN